MPALADFNLYKYEDGLLTVPLRPPAAVGGWDIRFTVTLRQGADSSGLIVKSVASGYGGGASGISVLNSGQGVLQVTIRAQDTSGLQPGPYAFAIERLDSGSRTPLTRGFLLLGGG